MHLKPYDVRVGVVDSAAVTLVMNPSVLLIIPLGGRAKEVVLGDTMVVDELVGLLGAVLESKVVVMEGVQHGVDCVV